MRWSWETAAFRDGPFGNPPWAVESSNVVRCDGGRAPTPASFEPDLSDPLSVPTLKPVLSLFLSPPPQAARLRARIARARATHARGEGIDPAYMRSTAVAIDRSATAHRKTGLT